MIECHVQFISTHTPNEQRGIHRALRNLHPGLVTHAVIGIGYSPGSIFCRVRGLGPDDRALMQRMFDCILKHGGAKATYIGVSDEQWGHPAIRLTGQLAA